MNDFIYFEDSWNEPFAKKEKTTNDKNKDEVNSIEE